LIGGMSITWLWATARRRSGGRIDCGAPWRMAADLCGSEWDIRSAWLWEIEDASFMTENVAGVKVQLFAPWFDMRNSSRIQQRLY
jgi:hypothetical protein